MKLDPFTLVVVGGVVGLVQSMAFGVMWFVNRGHVGMAHWSGSALMQGVALCLFATRQWTSDPWISRVIPTFLMMVCTMLIHAGAAAFRGRKPRLMWPMAISIPFFGAFTWFVVKDPDFAFRPLLLSPILAMFLMLGARELFGERRPGLRISAYYCGGLMASFALMFMARAFLLPWSGRSINLLDQSMPQMLTVASVILWGILLTLGVVLMLSQRQLLEVQQTNENLMQLRSEAWRLERELLAERGRRQRLGLLRDLHDGLGGITAHLAMVSASRDGKDSGTLEAEQVEQIQHLAVEGNRELRNLMNVLEHGETYWGEGLMEMRDHAAKVTEAQRIVLEWRVRGKVPAEVITDVAAMFSLMRVVKEATSNLARHSRARRARVEFHFRRWGLALLIEDDGRGLEEGVVGKGGRGLRYMTQRIGELGGRLRMRAGAMGAGVRLCAVLPLPLGMRGGLMETEGTRPKGEGL